MSDAQFLENKVEEALQLLSAHTEILEKQTVLMERMAAAMASMADHCTADKDCS